ncbi:hypothetical protein DEU52_1092 [Ensifer adhaerens]|nr:hypothetical protein DEU52_1092 [Ensifer adhaerens]
MENHVNWPTAMGARVLINDGWYKRITRFGLSARRLRRKSRRWLDPVESHVGRRRQASGESALRDGLDHETGVAAIM